MRDARSGSFALSALLWLLVVAAASGIDRLLVGYAWLLQLAFAVGIVLAVPAAARALRAHPVVPPLVATLTAIAVVTGMFVPSRALLAVVPTSAALGEAETLARAGFSSIAQQGLPAVADQGIAFLLVGGVVVLAWASDLFAFSVRLPALAGLFAATLLAVPAIVDPLDVSWPSLIVTALAFAGILAVSATPAHRRVPFGAALPTAAIVGVVVVAAGLLTGSAGGFARSSLSSNVTGSLFNGSIDPIVALGADLRRPNPVVVLRYSTDSELPVYLRVLTVSDFQGDDWAPTPTEQTAPIDAPIAPEGLDASVPRVREEVDVSIDSLRSQWLPVPYPVASLTGVGDGWLQDVQDGSIRGDATTRSGDDYRVEALRPEPDPQQLLAAPAATGLERYLAVPDDVPPLVRTTAEEVTARAGNDYDRARALQAYFRSAQFSYSEDTPAQEGYDGDGVGVLQAFLTTKAGYCVHFASAMAVMARELGIPSRLAIGYQPGAVVPSVSGALSSYRVLSSDLHAWPELYFEGVGWLPFEPTPSRGAPASYTLPSATASTAPSTPATPGAASSTTPTASSAPVATSTPTASAASTAPGAAEATATAPLVGGWLVLLLLVLVPWLLRAVQRGLRRRRASAGSIEAAWAELLAGARDLGLPVDAGSSLRAQEALLAESLGGRQGTLATLRGLRERVERRRYAPVSSAETGWEAGARVLAELRSAAGVPRRLLATVAPRSALESLAPVGRPRSDL
ncbi:MULTISPECIES: DUF3488 and transglutaminase-like domain-containing protein [unclassified Rathayibacter]|uniref:DUF3488 and transglutaminase-like domain-containing protein n=1 Tax=unclassified Rathayibacter TaxID=2609250 RepID=UPI00188A2EC7|nr:MULTISPECIES: DUF3488 and transglutaminase-like domain-containing protein [unclassified Rathayibacter]MBF4503941.1 hypothetical protein [Rathayibacter sp. VKM Ac-2878]